MRKKRGKYDTCPVWLYLWLFQDEIQRATVIIDVHNLDLIKSADLIIDIDSEDCYSDGQILVVGVGTVEEIVQLEESPIHRQYLKEVR